MAIIKILFIGDIVGKPGRLAVREVVRKLKTEHQIDLCVANGENSAHGSGITPKIANELFNAEIDVITSGDHIWKKREVREIFATTDRVLRPANYPLGSPGSGSCIVNTPSGQPVGIVNIIGRVFMQPNECPFRAALEEIDKLRKKTNVIIVDFHAEATSEKIAMGWHLDGKVSAVLGTHTHVPTADAKILPDGTAYITDVGMVGAGKSVLGRDVEPILEHFITGLPTRFTIATGEIVVQGALITIDDETGHAVDIIRMEKKVWRTD